MRGKFSVKGGFKGSKRRRDQFWVSRGGFRGRFRVRYRLRSRVGVRDGVKVEG